MVGQFESHLFNVAPVPILSWFVRADDRVAGDVEVSGGMFAGGLVAAADMATCLARAEVDPVVLSGGETVLTPLRLGDRVGYRVEVFADFQRRILFGSPKAKGSWGDEADVGPSHG